MCCSSYIAETSSSQPADETQDNCGTSRGGSIHFRGTLIAYVALTFYVTRKHAHCLADTFHSATERMSYCYYSMFGQQVSLDRSLHFGMANATSRSGHSSNSACNYQAAQSPTGVKCAGLSSVHRGCVWMYVLLSIKLIRKFNSLASHFTSVTRLRFSVASGSTLASAVTWNAVSCALLAYHTVRPLMIQELETSGIFQTNKFELFTF
jgi:hypothetical protein